jgi:hypothetical protein
MPTQAAIQRLADITDEDLIAMNLKRLLTLMKKAECTDAESTAVKLRRRKLQNRNSAKSSAARKQSQFKSVMRSNASVEKKMRKLESRNAELETAYADVVDKAQKTHSMVLQMAAENRRYQLEIDFLSSLLGHQSSSSEDSCSDGGLSETLSDPGSEPKVELDAMKVDFNVDI